MLIVFSGLPGVGKTVIAKELARRIGAIYLRIDSIEQAMRDSGAVDQPLNDAGYRVGNALAEDNLRLGHTVVADSVNPIRLSRDAWVDVAHRAGVDALEVEILCSDLDEHRRRVETRANDMHGLQVLTWKEVVSREYQVWDREHVVLDTARSTPEQSVRVLQEIFRNQRIHLSGPASG